MDSKKRRSTLRKSISTDVDIIKTQIKRRISFSGKNSVRVFHGEEEPKTWNNSYEISDHLNGNETASNLGAPIKNEIPRSALKNKHNNKENVGQSNTQQEMQMELSYHQKNMSVSNNQSIFSTTKDLINNSYQHQNSKKFHIENSVDITLNESEIQNFKNEQNKDREHTTNNLFSFSLNDNEKEARSIIFADRTVDYMSELRVDSSNIRDDTKTNNLKDGKCVTDFSEYMDEDQYVDVTCTTVKSSKEPITIYMNDSLSMSGNEKTIKNNRRTIQQATAMNLSPNMAIQYDKENINPTSLPNVNGTQNETCEMEINDELKIPSQTNDVNVQKETLAFQEKLNRLSFLQDSDDNMNIDNSLENRIAEPNIKARSTINFNEAMEMSPKETLVKNKKNSRETINCNQPIEISPQKGKSESSQIIIPIKKVNLRQSINFNKTIEFSPKNVDVKTGYNFFPKDKSRQTLNFNQSMEIDSKNAIVAESNNQQGTIPKVRSRPTINFHQPIETSPPKVKTNLPRQTINFNEDISDSPVKLTQKPVTTNNLNVPESIRKPGQLPKLVVRKICTPLVNKNKNPIDLEQQRMLRYKKKQEQNVASGYAENVAAVGIEKGKGSNAEKSLNFSLSSVKNMSLSPESSSPLIPSEFKALNFKQLNDELERGKINVFANAPKTPSTDRKNRNIASNFSSKHFQSSSQPLTKQRRTLVFDDVDIPTSSDDTLNKDQKTAKSNNFFDFNCTQDGISQNKKNNAKCRYSQADDIMLDNTSFLTRAKLSDETICRSTSKREVTQLNGIMDLFDESLRDAASKLDGGLLGSCVKAKKSCNKENDTLSSMFQNAKPIFTQAITNIKECNNYIDAYDIMDISTAVDYSKFKKQENKYDSSFHNPRQTILLNQNIEPCEVYTSNYINNRDSNEIRVMKSDRNAQAGICSNTQLEIDDQYGIDIEKSQQKSVEKINKIEHLNEDGAPSQKNKNESIHKEENIEVENDGNFSYNSKPIRKTLHFNNEFCELDVSIAQQQLDKGLTNTVDTGLNDENNIHLETTNKDEADMNTRQIHNLVEKCTIQTIYLNNDIDVSFNSEAKENTNMEKSTKSTNVNDDFKDFHLNVDVKDENINTQCTDTISSKRQTLYPNDYIGDEILFDHEKKTIIPQNNQNVSEESKIPRRNTIYFDNDNIIEDNQTTSKECDKSEIDKNGITLMYNSEINFDETLENPAPSLASIQMLEITKTDSLKSTRKTLYFNNEIQVEKDALRTKNNIDAENADVGSFNSKSLVTTLYFNNEIPIENPIQNIDVEIVDTGVFNSKPLRKTAFFNSEIPTENEQIESVNHYGTEIIKTGICDSNSAKNFYFDNGISVENVSIKNIEVCELDQSKSQTTDQLLCNRVSQSRKSIHISQDMDVTLNEVITKVKDKSDFCCPEQGKMMDTIYSNNVNENKQVVPRRKSVYTTENMDLTFDTDEQEKNGIVTEPQVPSKDNRMMDLNLDIDQQIKNTSEFAKDDKISDFKDNNEKSSFDRCPRQDKLMDFTLDAISSNNDNENKQQVVPRRKSIYTAEHMDLTFDGDEQETNLLVTEQQVPSGDNRMMDLDVDQQIENTSEYAKDDQISDFKDKYDMSIDQSFTPAENYQFPEPGEPLNAAKMVLARHTKSNSMTSKSKSTNTQENAPMTPVNFTGSNSNNRLIYMTPRLSLLEFTAEERKAKEEERLQNMKYISPLRNEGTNKRLPVNLTPVLSIPKKRQTLVFDDCQIDESSTSPQTEKNIGKLVSPKVLDYEMEMVKEQEPFRLSRCGTYNQVIEMSGIVSNESVLHTPPSKQKKSCIPIPISSGKKSYKSLVETTSDNNREGEDQINMEGDNLAESIQFMRRATTFTQRRDTTIGPIDLDIENEAARKPSIFEGNPITISDVSVFFEVQRKSNSLIPQTENNLAVEQNDVNGLKAIERMKKSLENHHLNLTLEDIEQTRLSLVRISYEEQEDTTPPCDDVVTENVENNLDWKNRRQSVNYLRNTSAVCRKCKRCQETVLNETTSSTYDSFVLPPLPPLPDLGLDRLRRLRKRPIISDVNIMWQRVSLDRTIINPFNISDDESQIISDLDDETEEESSAVAKCIRNYKNDLLSFETDLLMQQQNKTCKDKLPFVLRLDALLSANSTNWIFDFQMQSRGILLFTHKQLFTFAISLQFDEIDLFGNDINVKCVKLEKGHVLEKNWKAIDFVLDFQLKLNLPFDLQSLCEGSNEGDVFKMLQAIDRVCLDTIQMGNYLQRITFTNQASIIRDELRTYVRKIIRKIVKRTDNDFRYVEKTEFKVELLNLKKLSFKNIISPSLHNFREEIHLLPTGLQFLEEFLPNPLNYINQH
ncbi:uncharacterized protein LOC119601036 [Lucilia sericata]|uniref:uncharacterized protein LOC119601036 n=1 Tax=Lucilia sericata TaxID=13632 RepID=UPI0018A80A41|nr:uncharacterized protein LOC119601036 [Lucilia sericata]